MIRSEVHVNMYTAQGKVQRSEMTSMKKEGIDREVDLFRFCTDTLQLLTALASEQGNVIGSVRI